MKNNNRKIISKISGRSLKNSKLRNTFAILAIALTCMLFTSLASMSIGMMQVAQEETMREVGGKFHAGLKAATQEQMEQVTKDPRVVDFSWNILVSTADNIIKRMAEIRYPQGEQELANSFVKLSEGSLPKESDEIIVDTIVLDELGIPHEVGAQIPLEFQFQGEKIQKTFTVSGWYQGDMVSHASQLYVSESYWNELKGDLTDEDFLKWGEENPNDSNVGLRSVGLYFKKARNIEETVRSVIEDAGYDPDKELRYGVNWAYMSSRTEDMDPMSVMMLGGALVVVLLTGYLIIFNIFQISVINDIRFYGLLKTIGATKQQLRRLIRRQALVLSAAGIPLGLFAGYFISKGLFPFALSILEHKGMEMALHFDPWMILFGAAFSLLTVLISCRKPGKIAGSVSPIEAVRYSESTVKRKKQKKSETGAKIHRMALANLGRNKKKTVFVILSLSLSVTILCVVLTAVGSFRIDSYLGARLVGDVTVGSTNYTSTWRGISDFLVDEEMLELLDAQPGILTRNEMWTTNYNRNILLSDEAVDQYQEFRAQGKLSEDDEWSVQAIDSVVSDKVLKTDAYGYDEGLLEHLTVLKGELDIEKFMQGGYLLMSPIIGDHTEDSFLYEPGDKVTISTPAPDADAIPITNDDGEVIDIEFTKMEEKEYEVMAVTAEAPYAMDEHRYSLNGVQIILPKSDFTRSELSGYCFAVSYTLEEEALPGFIETVKQYTENVNPYMGYVTKEALIEEFSGMTNVIRTIGVALCIVIAVIGVLNFINSIFTGIIARKREFAILNSIGMTKQQLKKMLVQEGLYYVLISGCASIVLGSVLSWMILRVLNQVILFFEYRYNALAFFIMLPAFAVISVAAPALAYRKTAGESIVERLRETEG